MEETMTLTEPTISEAAAKRLNKRYLAAHDSDEAVEIAAEVRNTLAFKRLGFTTWSAWYKSVTRDFILVEKQKVEQRILDLRAAGESLRDIAKKTGVGRDTVHRVVKKNQDDQVSENRQNRTPTNADKDVEQQIANLWKAGETQQGIADRIGVNRNVVRRVIKSEGLDKQPTSNVTPITQKFHKRFAAMAEDLDFIIQKVTEDGGFAAAAYDQIDLLTEQRDQLTTLIEKLHKQFDGMPPMACATAL